MALAKVLAISIVIMTARMVTMIAYIIMPIRSSAVPNTSATAALIASFQDSAATRPKADVISAANVSRTYTLNFLLFSSADMKMPPKVI